MDKEDVLEMAKQCELIAGNAEHGIYIVALEKFAKLVAEKERERIFKQAPCEDAVQVSAWEFNMLTHQKEDMVGKPIAWAQWPKEEKNT